MKRITEKILLLAKVGCVALTMATAIVIIACNDDNCNRKPPKWELPQPIDASLLGSWESADGYLFITFYENNKCIIKGSYFANPDNEYRWSVNGNKIVMPDFYERRTGHFADYTYSFNSDKNLLYVELVSYPYLNCNNFTTEGQRVPFYEGTYKRLEED
jgi:hypothetical protein